MKIKGSYWFTGMNFHIGIVVGEDEVTGKCKAYISTVPGVDEEADTQLIARQGSPVNPIILNEIAGFFRTKEQKERDQKLVNATLDLMAELDPAAFKDFLRLHRPLCDLD